MTLQNPDAVRLSCESPVVAIRDSQSSSPLAESLQHTPDTQDGEAIRASLSPQEPRENTPLLIENLERIAEDATTSLSEFDRFTIHEAARRLSPSVPQEPK